MFKLLKLCPNFCPIFGRFRPIFALFLSGCALFQCFGRGHPEGNIKGNMEGLRGYIWIWSD